MTVKRILEKADITAANDIGDKAVNWLRDLAVEKFGATSEEELWFIDEEVATLKRVISNFVLQIAVRGDK